MPGLLSSIDVTLHIPVEDAETATAALVLNAARMLDAAQDYLHDPSTVVDSSHAEEVLYIEGAQGLVKSIRERACMAAARAFLDELRSPETRQDLVAISKGMQP